MRLILDTNVLLGALISPYGPHDAIYCPWSAAKFELVTSAAQLDALRRLSRYPKLKTLLPAHRVGTMVNNMQRATVLGVLPKLPDALQINDPNDSFLVAMAIGSEADYVVTGDRRPASRLATAWSNRSHAFRHVSHLLRRGALRCGRFLGRYQA